MPAIAGTTMNESKENEGMNLVISVIEEKSTILKKNLQIQRNYS